jgi:hypothetical protein
MFKKNFFLFVWLAVNATTEAQRIDQLINIAEVERIESVLSADDMQGRKPNTPGIEKAAAFIANEFRAAGLNYFDTLTSYRQSFTVTRAKLISANGTVGDAAIDPSNIIAFSHDALLSFTENDGYKIVEPDTSLSLISQVSKLLKSKTKCILFVDEEKAQEFKSLKRLRIDNTERQHPVIVVMTNKDPAKFRFEIKQEVTFNNLENVVGIIPGKSRKNELVIFSGHYDHLGIGKPNAQGDSIYNGANDDAAGTTAVLMLAKYFSAIKSNERTLIFVAFTAEESGGFGSKYFSKQIDAEKAVAMFNIEMIGTESKWGKKSAYITGYEKSDFGTLLQGNLQGSGFTFEADPYPKQNLFYRSDNATLAALGVPAHTISTSKMDDEKYYHTQDDEIETLDLANMTEIIKAIAISSKGIISGKETPARIAQAN